MEVDTIEVLKSYGVGNIISIGLMGSIVGDVGDIAIPSRAYVEEGISLHYYHGLYIGKPIIKKSYGEIKGV